MRPLLLVLLSLCIGASFADATDFHGVVTKVFDGDSFLVRPAERPSSKDQDIDVRLQDIDAPEKDQPYADVARATLKRLIEGRDVFVDVIEVDRYGRKVAKVYREPDRLDIGRTLVHDGHVWVNRRFAKDRSLLALEDKAREAQLGLWSLTPAELTPPWEFRRARRVNDRKERIDHQGREN